MSAVRVILVAGAIASAIGGMSARGSVSPGINPADNPKFYQRDPQETVIADINAWSHPAKQVFQKYHLKLTKIELMWNKTFPVFHVADFGADPGAGPASSFFTPLEMDLLKANGNNPFKLVEDNAHDGFVVAYDKKTHSLYRELVQKEAL